MLWNTQEMKPRSGTTVALMTFIVNNALPKYLSYHIAVHPEVHVLIVTPFTILKKGFKIYRLSLSDLCFCSVLKTRNSKPKSQPNYPK